MPTVMNTLPKIHHIKTRKYVPSLTQPCLIWADLFRPFFLFTFTFMNHCRFPNKSHFYGFAVALCLILPVTNTAAEIPAVKTKSSSLPPESQPRQLPECQLLPLPDSGQIRFQLSNPHPYGWRILSWKTPFDAWFSEFLTIADDNHSLGYRGALAKRGAPSEEDYVQLLPMQTLSVMLDLSQAYSLTPGQYQVTLLPLQLQALDFISEAQVPSERAEILMLQCPSLTLTFP
jgi:hypothetical protein